MLLESEPKAAAFPNIPSILEHVHVAGRPANAAAICCPSAAWQLPAAQPASAAPCLRSIACLPPCSLVPCRQGCCKRRFGWLLEHIESQTTCLFDDQGRPAVDFLGRVENLDDDMQASLK